MKVLDLFSGIGGFSLGLESAGMETVAFCEIEPFCQKVLKKHWPDVPIFNDVRSLDYEGPIDVICGGFPCQPFSVAGKREGTEDDRHLWPAMFDLIKKHRPCWVIGENVTGIIGMALDDVLADLEGEAYTTTSFIIPACAVNAPHRRDRVWIVANARSARRGKGGVCKQKNNGQQIKKRRTVISAESGKASSPMANSHTGQCYRQEQEVCPRGYAPNNGGGFWAIESSVGRVANGIPDRSHRLKALGNAVVPQIPEIIGRAIIEIENNC